MSCPAQWALSPLDLQAHLLLPEGCHPKGVLKARCGHLLPLRVMRFVEVSVRKCTDCHLMSLSDAILSFILWRDTDLIDGKVVRRVVITVDATLKTATILTQGEAVEVAEAMTRAAGQ